MGNKAQDILKKINYIEVDLDIQKQILFSIPSADTEEIEKTLKIIADKKEQINALRQEIQTVSPEAYKQILLFEKAAQQFKELAGEKQFKEIVTFDGSTPCTISLKDGTNLDCLVKARDNAGEWTVLTFDGEIRTFSPETTL